MTNASTTDRTLAGMQEPYAALKLSELSEGDRRLQSPHDVASSIRQYLYQKYVYRTGGEPEAPAPLRFAVAGAHHE